MNDIFDLNLERKNLLYELYLHNYVLLKKLSWSPNPYIGVVQLRAFMYWIQNKTTRFRVAKNYKVQK